MVRRKTRKRESRLIGSHQRCWLWGRHLVCETLRAGLWIPLEVRLAHRLTKGDTESVEQAAATRGIPVQVDSSERLTQLCGNSSHQGFLAKMPPFPYATLDELLRNRTGSPLWAALAGLQDPHNLGAIIRSAEVLGVDALVLAKEAQVGITAAVARSSAGAVNSIPICQVDDLKSTFKQLQTSGFQIVGADAQAPTPADRHDFTHATAIVIGNESTGLAPELRQRCTTLVSIPQAGQIESLNASVAAGILFYEAQRQRSRQ